MQFLGFDFTSISIGTWTSQLPGAIVGALVGALFGASWQSLRFLLRKLRRHRLSGEWNHYYWNWKTGTADLRHDRFIVKRGFRQPLVFKRTPQNHNGSSYHGHLSEEGEFVLSQAIGDKDGEVIFQRFRRTPYEGNEYLVALCLARNFNNETACNPAVLSRNAISGARFEEILRTHVLLDDAKKLVRVVTPV